MGRDHHTSKSRLNLRDGIIKKPQQFPHDPHIAAACGRDGKKCAQETMTTFQKVMGEYPKPIRTFGPRQIQVLNQFRTSALIYGMTAVLTTVYFCEWKAVLQYLPYYNGKYATDD